MAAIKVTLRLFGSLREAIGESSRVVELESGSRVLDLRAWLAQRSPLVDQLGGRLAASVNLEIAEQERELSDGDEVAFCRRSPEGTGA